MSPQIRNRLIRYYRIDERTGASHARNVGIENSHGKWICYVDSDNTIDRDFLQVFANAIEKEPADCYYAQLIYKSDGREGPSRPFDYELLKKGNYIDMGVFVHRRDLIITHGEFDEKLNRLIDWDLILRYTADTKVVYIPQTVMSYNDIDDHERITNTNSYNEAINYIKDKQIQVTNK